MENAGGKGAHQAPTAQRDLDLHPRTIESNLCRRGLDTDISKNISVIQMCRPEMRTAPPGHKKEAQKAGAAITVLRKCY